MVIRNTNKSYGSSGSNVSWPSRRGGATGANTPSAAARIKCSRGEWKTRDQFSNKSLTDFDRLVTIGRARPDNSTIVCREHTATQLSELQCHGPCGRMKPINDFSKSSRRNKKYLCKDCTAYHTADLDQDLPPPGAVLSPDEMQQGRPAYDDIRDDEVEGSVPDSEIHLDEEFHGSDAMTESSAGSSYDSDSMYFSDGSEGTVRAGLGSLDMYPESDDTESKPELFQFSRPAQSETGDSASRFSSHSSDTQSATSSTRTNQSREPVIIRKGGWVKERPKKQDWNVPDYVRNLNGDQVLPTPRPVDYESDDSM
ncbi:Stc1 domain containing protein [Rhypophila decipiens]